MRALFLRAFAFAALCVAAAASQPTRASAQAPGPRYLPLATEPFIPTRIESLLATPNEVLLTDYYRIDMRFGPNMRIDAVIVEAVDSHVRFKGLRVQVRDPQSRGRQEGTSYIDIDELVRLSRGLTAMADLATKWTLDDRQGTGQTFTRGGGFP